MFIYRVIVALEKHNVDYGIAGGFAVALHGAVRGTIDLDLVLRINKKQFQAAEAAFKSVHLVPRLPVTAEEVFDFREEYINNRNLFAWSFSNLKVPSEIVDVVITHDLAKMKTVRVKSGTHVLRVLSVSDLIKMKRASGRPQDLEDIKALEKLQP
jgi:hypothetical protein